jgi:toxin FitB
MSGFLLDTNIVSELRKGNLCNAGVRAWMENAAPDEMYLSVLVLGEIRKGIELIRIRDQAQAVALEKWLEGISTRFSDRILSVDERVADRWGRLGLRKPVPTLDAMQAATALVHDLTVVSRDEDGFRGSGVRFVNPFSR